MATPDNNLIDSTVAYNQLMPKNTTYNRIVAAYKSTGHTSSQSAIARDLGLFQSAVAAWKRGGNVTPGHMLAIAKRTGYCVEWLYMGRGPERPADVKVSQLIDKLNALDPDNLERVLKIAVALSEE